MTSLGLSRYALTMGVAAAMLAGCGGSQPPIGVPGAMPQTHAIVERSDHAKWQSLRAAVKDAWSGDLLYVATAGGDVYVLSFYRPASLNAEHAAASALLAQRGIAGARKRCRLKRCRCSWCTAECNPMH